MNKTKLLKNYKTKYKLTQMIVFNLKNNHFKICKIKTY